MSIRHLLLQRSRRAVVAAGSATGDPALVRAFELELASLGYVVGGTLRARLGTLTPDELAAQLTWMSAALWERVGGKRTHTPLFRKFPRGVPTDTFALWIDKVIVHYLQEPDQPCLFCGASGSTHVLKPCAHVVCARCWDGANYSRCPVCEHAVERDSPFFLPDAPRPLSPQEKVTFQRIDLCEDEDAETARLVQGLLTRTQVMNPDDVEALQRVVAERSTAVLAWTPANIPVRENRALLFGTLMRLCPHEQVLAVAAPHLTTATDLLRVVAVMAGHAAGLMPAGKQVRILAGEQKRWFTRGGSPVPKGSAGRRTAPTRAISTAVFSLPALPRATRRALLACLDGLNPEALATDMLRHRALWVRLGEVLHPFEYARRFPNAARAFAVVRKSRGETLGAVTGAAVAPIWWRDDRGRLRLRTFAAWTEIYIDAQDGPGLARHLAARPGELARRLDLALRLCPDAAGRRAVADVFLANLARMATPVLLGLSAGLPARNRSGGKRVFFPAGAQFIAPSAEDERARLPASLLGELVRAIQEELLRRFADKPAFASALLDRALADVVVPFNERSASPAAVNLPRGSRIRVEPCEALRLFLHWCQPPDGHTTDLDLSVGFYDEAWALKATCSYYQLRASVGPIEVARSSGDVRDAPHPDGGSEFVDVRLGPAREAGLRFAVMVVNAYAGLPFSKLERAYAGLMTRDDTESAHFDPRMVKLRFNLQGEHGCFMPLVFDLRESTLFWLDASHKGQFEFNNLAKSNKAISRICPETMAYFGSGVRPSLFQLGALHAAARCARVTLRGPTTTTLARGPQESAHSFFLRILEAEGEETGAFVPDEPVFAALLTGDLELPAGSQAYALFAERLTGTLAAAELLA